MSVAASLAQLRQNAPGNTKPAPSLLYSAKERARPRAQIAALAQNGIDALAAVDPKLGALSDALLLSNPRQDRATLPPPAAAALSAAVVSAATRLAPVFPLRAATKVHEWLIQGLRVGQLGTGAEHDAILLSALPFHATAHFVRLVRALLLTAPRLPRWAWLEPVVKQNKPLSLQHLVSHCPSAIIRALLDAAAHAINADISNVPQTSLLANLLAPRLADRTQPSAERRQLLLHALATAASVRKLGHDGPKTAAVELLCAVLTCAAAALAAGVDAELSAAVSTCASSVLLKTDAKSILADTAAACLALAVTRGPVPALPVDAARGLLHSPAFTAILERLSRPDLAQTTYLAVVMGAVHGVEPNGSGLPIVRKALAVEGDVLSDASVTKVLVELFKMFSVQREEAEDALRDDVICKLVGMLAPLARGRHVAGVDAALRTHFESRKRRKASGGSYELVDEVLSKALSDTQFDVLKVTEPNSDGISSFDGTMIGALDHPVPVVRRMALQKLLEELVGADGAREGDGTSLYPRKMLQMIRDDGDVECVALAMKCVCAILPKVDVSELLMVATCRVRAEHDSLSTKKKKKLPKGMRHLVHAFVSLCVKLNEFDACKVEPLLIGMILAGSLPVAQVAGLCSSLRQLIPSCFSTSEEVAGKDGDGDSNVYEEVKLAVSLWVEHDIARVKELLKDLEQWDALWAIMTVKSWLLHLSKLKSRTNLSGSVQYLVAYMSLKFEELESHRPTICEALVSKLAMFRDSEMSKSNLLAVYYQVWAMVARTGDGAALQAHVGHFVEQVGIEDTVATMQRGCSHSAADASEDVRRVSLKWYLNLCSASRSPDAQKESMYVLLHALYGDENVLREGVGRFCWANRLTRSRDSALTPELQALQEAVVRLLEGNGISTEVFRDDKVTSVLHSSVLSSVISGKKLTLPLVCSGCKQGEGRFEDMLECILQRIVDSKVLTVERLQLLRAVGGVEIKDHGLQRKLLVLLKSQVEQISLEDESGGTSVECISRLVALLSHVDSSSLPGKTITVTAKSILSKLNALREEVTTDHFISPQIEVVLVCALTRIFLLFSSATKTANDAKKGIFEQLLAFSTRSSIGGRAAQSLLVEVFDSAFPLPEMSPYLEALSEKLDEGVKRPRANDEQSPPVYASDFTAQMAVGALRSVRRRVSAGGRSEVTLRPLKASLWAYFVAVMNLAETDGTVMDDASEYELESVLEVLSLLHSSDPHRGSDDSFVDVDALVKAVFFPYPGYDGDETALTSAIRRSGLDLVEVLGYAYGAELQSVIFPIIEKLLSQKDSSRALSSLSRLVPSLLASGCEFRKLCNWLCTATYAESGRQSNIDGKRAILASCSRMNSSDPAFGVVTCLQEVVRRLLTFRDQQAVAEECSKILVRVNQSATEDLRTICAIGESIQCDLAAAHVLHSAFIAKLSRSVRDSDGREAEHIGAVASELFTKLLGTSVPTKRKAAVGALLAILPLEPLGGCIVQTLSSKDHAMRIRTLEALSYRLDAADVPLMYTWNFFLDSSDLDVQMKKTFEKNFVGLVGTALCDLCAIRTEEGSDEVSADIRQTAVANLEKLNRRLGPSAPGSILQFSGSLVAIVNDIRSERALSHPSGEEEHCTYLSSILLCLSSMMVTLRKRAVPFIPKLMDVSATILERAFLLDDKTSQDVSEGMMSTLILMAEAAVRTCTTVLETNPKMFGRKTLQRIASLAVTVKVDVLEDLVDLAVQRVPCSSAVMALSAAVERISFSSTSHTRVTLVMRCVKSASNAMGKSELKKEFGSLLEIFLKCLDFRHKALEVRLGSVSGGDGGRNGSDEGSGDEDSAGGDTGDTGDALVSASRAVDICCADALTTLVLKLSESDFKVLYNKLIQWAEGGLLPDEASSACETTDFRVTKNILRAISLYRVSASLFKVLQSLMIPYFSQLLDDVLDVISTKRVSAKVVAASAKEAKGASKKRKRSVIEAKMTASIITQLSTMQQELCDLCMDNLTIFLRQGVDGTLLSTSVVSKMQDGLMCAFDEADGDYTRVADALNALAMRMLTVGSTKDSKEESRELLMALSRALLLRSRSPEARVREASLTCARGLATTVGDEFLVTLPESMPVLADVIDDEDPVVQKAAKAFAGVMEGLAGEPILEQIK